MKPRPPKTTAAAPTEENSSLSLLRKIQSGSIHPSNLSAEARQSLVEHLSAEGYSTAEIAEILKTSERTVARDRKTIRDANAVQRDPAMVGQMVGQLLLEAQNCITRIRRAARDKEAAPAVRIDAEHRVYQIFSDLVQRLQGLGYLPSTSQKIKAEVTHQMAESDDAEILQAEIIRMLNIGTDLAQSGSAEAAASLEGLNQVLQLLPGSSSSSTPPTTSQQEQQELKHEQSK